MSEFVKLFQSEKYGQICVIKQDNEECMPELFFMVQYKDSGVCSNSLAFTDSNEGYDKRDNAFYLVDLETSEAIAKQIFDALSEIIGKSPVQGLINTTEGK